MQLSAPTLPIDPSASRSADASGFPPTGGKADTDSSSPSDFGAMLSAESRGNSRGSAASRSNPRGATKAAEGKVDDRGNQEFARGGNSASSTHQSQTSAETASAPDALVIASGVIVPTSSPPVQDPTVPAIDLMLNVQSPAVGTDEANTTQESIASTDGSSASGRILTGRAFSGEMPAGKSQAGIHAYGLRGETPAGPPGGSIPAQTPGRGVKASPATGTAQPSPAHVVGSANAPVVSPIALNEPTGLGSTSSSPNTSPSTGSFSSETSIVAAQPAVTPANNPATASTQAGQTEQILEGSGELPSAVLDEAPLLADELIEPEVSQTLAADIPEDGSADEVEMAAPAVTTAVAEKIAAELSRFADRVADTAKRTQRVSLTSGSKEVEASYGSIGINVAKPETLMPAQASTPTQASIAIEHAFSATPLSFDSLVKEGGEGTQGQMAQVARRAVESALAVADQYITGDKRSVKLQFTVGGEQLAVRVELKGNQVHTTFRTDSPELRSALAQEWQSVSAAQTGVRPQRLADPVFASNSSTGQGMSSDSGAAHQRDSGARHPQTAPEEIFGARHDFSTTPAAPAVVVTTAVTAAREPSSLRLQTFA